MRLFGWSSQKFPTSDSLDLANSTRPRRAFVVLSHQVLEEKGRYPTPEIPRLRLTITTPQQSRELLSIFVPLRRVAVVRWGFFGYLMCAF